MELDNESVKQISDIDDRIDNQTSPRYKSVGEAFQGIGTTVASMASGAVSATLGLPTDIVAAGVGIKDAIFADDNKRMDAFSKGFTEVSKENMGSEYYKENFNTLLDSLTDNPVIKEDAKSGFSAGEFGGVGGVAAKAPKIARNVIAQKETAREILSSLGLSSKAMKNINVDNMSVDGAINLAKKLKVARAKLYGTDEQGNIGNAVMAMTAKREPSPVRQASNTEKAIPVMPVNQSSLEVRGFGYQAGGKYINPITKEDLTGKNIGSANIKINPEKGVQGGKPQADFIVKNVGVSEVGSKGKNIVTNLIKPSSKGKKAGWSFINKNKEVDENINTLVAVVQDNKHYYTLETDFSKGANLKTYPNKKDEPRLRPSVKGNLEFGNVIAKIKMGKYPDKIKDKPHPMAGKDRIHNLYDKITAYKDGGLVKQKGLMART